MLVLTRRAGQAISIGNDIVITVRQIQGNSVRIAIDAPRNVQILRQELQSQDVPMGERSSLAKKNEKKCRTCVSALQLASSASCHR